MAHFIIWAVGVINLKGKISVTVTSNGFGDRQRKQRQRKQRTSSGTGNGLKLVHSYFMRIEAVRKTSVISSGVSTVTNYEENRQLQLKPY